ncbi:Serine/threonine-protein kinase StkP [Planctomycetes bacterium Poly30]|uniref:Serine/threonine-protein kinase StkP n=1 Tax=Saltatorellus ferox TaxID=2528018 RepID=A0A518EYW4_9BACT|nr:Serine/threonine-protein kinase StkP [Planctomycetes bacterium Poly30]
MTQARPKLEPDQWAAVLDAVEAVIDGPTGAHQGRLEELRELLGGDPKLVEKALEMLALEDGTAAHGLNTPVDALSSVSAPFAAWGSIRRDEVGPYRLHEEIGRGGMGQVFLASRSDGSIDRRVALKLVHPGLGTQEVIARFERERQVQASLLHPGIAILLDGGTTSDGLPYLVMEYVDGQRMDRWCDERKLSLPDRLALFIKVAGAVAYAHECGVIHRDLKPSNILVTSDGEPKLLDFGIAKVFNRTGVGAGSAQETLTLEGMQRMTPAYASPEQLRGRQVTVGTDIYSLGTLLFELLTGHTPHMLSGYSVAEIERAVCEVDPRRPSRAVLEEREMRGEEGAGTTQILSAAELGARRSSSPTALRRRIQGDLERIVMKCLRKEPERRYASVAGLIADLGRYGVGRPILARPESLIYRARTFVRRHWVGVAAAASVIVALAGALAFSLVQYGQAVEFGRLAADRGRLAEERLGSLRQFRWDMLNRVAPTINEMPDAIDARERIILAVMACLERETMAVGDDAAPRIEELINSYLALAKLQGHPRAMNRGRADAAKETLLKAERCSAQLMEAFPGKSRAHWLRGRVLVALGSLLASDGDHSGAESSLVEAAQLADRALVDQGFDQRDRLYYIRHEALLELAYLALGRGELDEARGHARASEAVLDELIGEFPDQVYFLDGDRVNVRASLAEIANRAGAFCDGLAMVEPARERLNKIMASHAPNGAAQDMDARMLSIMADSLEGLGREDEAVAAMTSSVAVAAASFEVSKGDIRSLETLVARQLELGELLLRVGQTLAAQEALEAAVRTADMNTRQRQQSYVNVLRRIDLEAALARCASQRGEGVRAVEFATSAAERLEKLSGELDPHLEIQSRRAQIDRALRAAKDELLDD